MPSQRWLHIIPVAFIMYTIAFIDRTNISLALPSMSRALHMSPPQAGAAAGIFFWGYLLLQIPGGYLAQRWSAKRFVSILLVLWGACSVGCGLVHTWREFWMMRFLLGVAEGGVWPATLVLLAHWFPRAERARANAYWMLCLPVAVVVSSPLSGWILGRWNWRVLLISEGLFPLLWLLVWWWLIDDHPGQARWISPQECHHLETTLERESKELDPVAPGPMSFTNVLFSFEGRITRAQWWGYFIPYFVVYVCLCVVGARLQSFVSVLLYGLVMLYPTLAVNVKRCHDRGRSGWFILVGLLPILNFWYATEICFLRGTNGANEYGPDPLQQKREAPFTPEPLLRSILRLWVMVAFYFLLNSGNYGYLFWLPSAMEIARKLSSAQVGVLFALPYVITAIGMIIVSRHSDQKCERRGHVAFAMAWAGAFMLASVLLSRPFPALSFLAVSFVGAGSFGALGPFWAIPTETLPRAESGPTMGLVNALGNLGGYFGPLAIGYINQHTGNFVYAFGLLSAAYFSSSVLILFLRPQAAPGPLKEIS
jgi:MFS family permease